MSARMGVKDRRPSSVSRDVMRSVMVIRGQCHAIIRCSGRADELVERVKIVDSELARIADATQGDRAITDPADVVDGVDLARRAVRRFDGAAGAAGGRIALSAQLPAPLISMRAAHVEATLDEMLAHACGILSAGDVIAVCLTQRDGVAMLRVAIDRSGPRPAPGRWSRRAIVGTLADRDPDEHSIAGLDEVSA